MYTFDVEFANELLSRSIPSFQATCRETQNLGFGHIFYGVARALRPRHVVVIGSKAGFAPICFAKAIQDNEGHGIVSVGFQETALAVAGSLGHVDFIDPSYSIERNDPGHSFGIGTWDDPEAVMQIWRSFGVEDVVTHYKVRSAEYLAMPQAHDIDLLYVDGDHSYNGIMHDLTEFHSRLSEAALVLAHDVDPRCSHESDGYRVLQDLPSDMYEFVRIPVYPGLAIFRPL